MVPLNTDIIGRLPVLALLRSLQNMYGLNILQLVYTFSESLTFLLVTLMMNNKLRVITTLIKLKNILHNTFIMFIKSIQLLQAIVCMQSIFRIESKFDVYC